MPDKRACSSAATTSGRVLPEHFLAACRSGHAPCSLQGVSVFQTVKKPYIGALSPGFSSHSRLIQQGRIELAGDCETMV